MHAFIKIALSVLLLTHFATTNAHTADQCGYGYAECRRAPVAVAAAVVLGAVAIAAMVAITISDSSCSHSH